ncbi:MAG: hypothetical protein A2816_00085 [Candidatus Yanofskybacteria bacterium RIFCSPHIGHO2_01_FULL_39_44]|nr:MAG: hypothetical protein A2816_00085 [Candidatus Yanofskybacteria bacterium RIFCSPHIGHO2_01_FULL_39_44]
MDKVGTVIIAIFQLLSKILMVFFQLIFRPQITRPQGLRVPRGTLIVSNHQSFLDPWLVCHYIPLKDVLTMLPLRYPVTPEYIRRPILGFFIRCFGGYDIGYTSLEKAKRLLYTRDLIHAGYTVMLFPEGKLEKEGLGEFQKGVDMLAQEDIPLLLARISGINNGFDFSRVRLKFSSLIKDVPAEEKVGRIYEFFKE